MMEAKMKNLADIRKDYASQTLDPDDCLAHPVDQFTRWLDDAIAAEVEAAERNRDADIKPGTKVSRGHQRSKTLRV